MKKVLFVLSVLFLFGITGCSKQTKGNNNMGKKSDVNYQQGTFGYDLNFLKSYHRDMILLSDTAGNSKIIILPQYQGRVMTSTLSGDKGISIGWVNHKLISSGTTEKHINAFGGEERFWLGPEGGQFSVFFKKGKEFKYDNWFVPKELDTEAFTLVSSNNKEAKFEKEMHLENYSGNKFDVKINRNIRLLDNIEIEKSFDMVLPAELKAVAFESENIITNIGIEAWTKKTGMLSIWILSMLNATDRTTVAIPYQTSNVPPSEKIVTDDYFGKVPPERLKITGKIILFKADANYRSKIGISPSRTIPIVASYDESNNLLTIAQFNFSKDSKDYVNSQWKIQDNPFEGDVVNSYNDGPIDGNQLGKFYEIESSSSVAALEPGKSLKHMHRTIHITGDKESLNAVCKKMIGVDLDEIKL